MSVCKRSNVNGIHGGIISQQLGIDKARRGCYNPYYLTGNCADITMRLSTRGEYGVRAMVALARRHGGPPCRDTEIAAVESISLSYLEQLVAALRRAGLVTAVRGASGGYQLARPPRRSPSVTSSGPWKQYHSPAARTRTAAATAARTDRTVPPAISGGA